MSKFITETVTIKNRGLNQEFDRFITEDGEFIHRIVSREERLTLEIELVSSGDTTTISNEDIMTQVLEKLKYITEK